MKQHWRHNVLNSLLAACTCHLGKLSTHCVMSAFTPSTPISCKGYVRVTPANAFICRKNKSAVRVAPTAVAQQSPQAKDITAVRKPEECMNMTHVREQIDRVDKDLVYLLKTRWGYIHRASEVKQRLGTLPALIPWRVEDVVDKVRAHAKEVKLCPDLIENVWRTLMVWYIQYEDDRLHGIAREFDGDNEKM